MLQICEGSKAGIAGKGGLLAQQSTWECPKSRKLTHICMSAFQGPLGAQFDVSGRYSVPVRDSGQRYNACEVRRRDLRALVGGKTKSAEGSAIFEIAGQNASMSGCRGVRSDLRTIWDV